MMTDAEAFSQRIYEAILPVTERYVEESGRPDRVFAAVYDPTDAMLDFNQTHFPAQPARPRLTEPAARLVVNHIVGIPNTVVDEVLVPAFAEQADAILEYRRQRPVVQLADHAPNQLPVATQFAGNLALADRMVGATQEQRLRLLIHQSHGIGTVGFRPLGIRPVPHGPGILIGRPARWLTHTHYSIPATKQYFQLDLTREDQSHYNGAFVQNLVNGLQQDVHFEPQSSSRLARIESLKPECVINPVGTKEVEDGKRIVIPRAKKATGMLVELLGAGIVPVYTSFTRDEKGKIIGGQCEVGDIMTPEAGQGVEMIHNYLTQLADYRSEREDREVVYEAAA